jgi:hypothetical protein
MPKILHITPESGTWGQAQIPDVAAVLRSAAMQLWRHCSNTTLNPIIVRQREGNPQIAFARDEWARIQVWLSASDRVWNKYAYQFAHEFCHALAIHSNEDADHWHELKHANHWLEESICETASLFALRSMAAEWQTNAPYPNWSSYTVHLAKYAQDVVDEGFSLLAASEALSAWIQTNERVLRNNSLAGNTDGNRSANKIVATRLPPIFEANPTGWEALTRLNLVSKDINKPLDQQLIEWRDLCSEGDQKIVIEIGNALGLNI